VRDTLERRRREEERGGGLDAQRLEEILGRAVDTSKGL
jgi:hypothetical protein